MFGESLKEENKSICFSGTSSSKDFQCLVIESIWSLDFLEKTQSLPLYRYNSEGQKIENITDWALDLFQNHYVDTPVDTHCSGYLQAYQRYVSTDASTGIHKTDIFHYVYGVLHNPAYRKKYEQNLKRDFPHIPLYDDFWFWADKGKELMDLHLNYETIKPYKLTKVNIPLPKSKLNKPKLKADKEKGLIYLDQVTSLEGVPSVAFDYKLGNRSALEWVLDQYKEKKPRDKTIGEKFNTYRLADYKEQVIDLLQRVCTVSVKTMEIIKVMEKSSDG